VSYGEYYALLVHLIGISSRFLTRLSIFVYMSLYTTISVLTIITIYL